MYAFVARQIVTQPPDLPVVLLDDNVPRVLFGRPAMRSCTGRSERPWTWPRAPCV